jgi:hypothetical protein
VILEMKADPLDKISSSAMSTAVLSYLAQHPEAQDTIEGIAEWWLLEHRIVETTKALEAVLNDLVQQDFLLASKCAEGRLYYRLNREREREIHSHLRDTGAAARRGKGGFCDGPSL